MNWMCDVKVIIAMRSPVGLQCSYSQQVPLLCSAVFCFHTDLGRPSCVFPLLQFEFFVQSMHVIPACSHFVWKLLIIITSRYAKLDIIPVLG